MRIEQDSTFHIPHSAFQQEGARVLVVAEGSGGHLIPAVEVSRALRAAGSQVCLLYARRPHMNGLFQGFLEEAQEDGVQLFPVQLAVTHPRMVRSLSRMWQAGRVWRLARARLAAFHPQVVVGFGGWISIPVIAAARQQRIPVLLHEQNVRLGRANRFLLRWADEVAVSFDQTRRELNGTKAVVTGLPIRQAIGAVSRGEAARRCGFDPDATTLLILGGSQGARPINRFVCDMLRELTEAERAAWQFIHLTGTSDYAAVREAYTAARVRCWVAPYLTQMDEAYALATAVIARAGASTIAELARCGTPALLIPYPYASGHQRDNARFVESLGAGVWVEESNAGPKRILALLRNALLDPFLQRMMGAHMRQLARPDAAQRLAAMIAELAAHPLNGQQPHPVRNDSLPAVGMDTTHHNGSVDAPRELSLSHGVHFVGIGGIGMSGLARICHERGHAVSGCDATEGRAQRALQEQGIPVAIGHHPRHLTHDVGLVVYSSAVSPQTAELCEARTRGFPIMSRGELLAELTSSARLVAVAGAHGKTTTSGMAAQLLVQAGWDPTVVVGGNVRSLGSNARNGRGRYLVAETDESDGSFLLLRPSIAIVTNIDREHLNYYQSFDNLVLAFRQFVDQLGPEGALIRCEDDPVIREFLSHPRQIRYGMHPQADVTAAAIRSCGWGSAFTAIYQGRRLGTFRLRVPGRHNVLNALAVISLGIVLDMSLALIREALETFSGTSRRFDLFQLPNDVWFIEDYAHHPTEIRATLTADPFVGRHRVVVFQPHRFSRTKLLEHEFTSCFDHADGIIVTDIYPAFETPIPGVSGERMAALIKAQGYPCVRYVPRSALSGYLAHFIQPQDTVFFLGAGDIGELCHELAAQLRSTNGITREPH